MEPDEILIRRADIRLMGMAEIAGRLRVTRARAGQITDSVNLGFPRPIARLRLGQVWLEQDVEAWIAAHRAYLNEPEDEA
ncbi:DNA-binding protein [Actinoplanes sp. TBRC 11911]|uniref:DNA-binding protein n=1 Tax=Actinoplanes sp. TBRC 11911 TaxID=2729386 RepID=UPI002898E9C2|nr:DNA-binding protein [Actinoplanes sp. TBRC 11911]